MAVITMAAEKRSCTILGFLTVLSLHHVLIRCPVSRWPERRPLILVVLTWKVRERFVGIVDLLMACLDGLTLAAVSGYRVE